VVRHLNTATHELKHDLRGGNIDTSWTLPFRKSFTEVRKVARFLNWQVLYLGLSWKRVTHANLDERNNVEWFRDEIIDFIPLIKVGWKLSIELGVWTCKLMEWHISELEVNSCHYETL
jgi:hypothetical protein